MEPRILLNDWFGAAREDASTIESRYAFWFQRDDQRDAKLQESYASWVAAADEGVLRHWQDDPWRRLALILLLDQLPRNLFRSTPGAFTRDATACVLTLAGVATDMDKPLSLAERAFFYMPLQHAEDQAVQQISIQCYENLLADNSERYEMAQGFMKFAREHADIIHRFGRFPHRNKILGRKSTDEEMQYLCEGAPTYGQS